MCKEIIINRKRALLKLYAHTVVVMKLYYFYNNDPMLKYSHAYLIDICIPRVNYCTRREDK